MDTEKIKIEPTEKIKIEPLIMFSINFYKKTIYDAASNCLISYGGGFLIYSLVEQKIIYDKYIDFFEILQVYLMENSNRAVFLTERVILILFNIGKDFILVDIEEKYEIRRQYLSGSYRGSCLIEYYNTLMVYTTDISNGLAQMFSSQTGDDQGYFSNLMENTYITDIQFNSKSQVLYVQLLNGIIFQHNLKLFWFQDTSYYHSEMMNLIHQEQFKKKFLLDIVFNRIIVFFKSFFLVFDTDLTVSSAIPYYQTPYKFFQSQVREDLDMNGMNLNNFFYLDGNNVIWMDNGNVQFEFIRFGIEIKHLDFLDLQNGIKNQNQSQFILCLFTENKLVFVNDKSEILQEKTIDFIIKFSVKVRRHIYALSTSNVLRIISPNLTPQYKSIDAYRIEYMYYYADIGAILFEDVNNKIILFNIFNQSLLYTANNSIESKCLNIQYSKEIIYCLQQTKILLMFSYKKEQISNLGIKYNINENELESTFNTSRLSFVEYDFYHMRVFIGKVNSKLINVFNIELVQDQDFQLLGVKLKKIGIILASHTNAKYIHFLDNFIVLETLSDLMLLDRVNYRYYHNFGVSLRLDVIKEVTVLKDGLLNCLVFNSKKYLIVLTVAQPENKFKLIYSEEISSIRILKQSIEMVDLLYVVYLNLIYERENVIQKTSILLKNSDKYVSYQYIETINEINKQKYQNNQQQKCYVNINQQNSIFQRIENITILINSKKQKQYQINLVLNDEFVYHSLVNKLPESQTVLTSADDIAQQFDEFMNNTKKEYVFNKKNETGIKFFISNYLKITNYYIGLTNMILQVQESQYSNLNLTTLKLQNIIFQGKFSTSSNKTTINGTNFIFRDHKTIIIENLALDNIIFNYVSYNTPFITFKEIKSIQINNLIIKNCVFIDQIAVMQFIGCNKTEISHLFIMNNTFERNSDQDLQTLFYFQNIQQLSIKDSQFEQNNNLNQFSQDKFIIFYFEIVLDLLIKNCTFNENKEVILIKYNNYFSKDDYYNEVEIESKNDIITIQNCTFENNFSKVYNQSHIQIQSNCLNLNYIQFINNKCLKCYLGNIYLYQISYVSISSSTFNYNNATSGGAIYFILKGGFTQLFNTSFNYNNASYSGGGIMLEETNAEFISTKFENNQAVIGAGIRQRFLYTQGLLDYLNCTYYNISADYSQNFTFYNNTASMFGNNIGLFPAYIESSMNLLDLSDELIVDNNNLNFKKILDVNQTFKGYVSISSGSKIKIVLIFKDLSGQIVNFSPSGVDEISEKVISEQLNGLNIKISSLNSNLYLEGELYIKLQKKNLNKDTKAVEFGLISFQGNHKTCSNFTIHSDLNSTSFLNIVNLSGNMTINVCFEPCKSGDIPQLLPSNKIKCSQCNPGTYNLEEFYFDQFDEQKIINNLKQNPVKCKKCDEGADICQRNQITLKNDYWNDQINIDVIVKCNRKSYLDYSPCQSQNINSKHHCLEGHIGAICESCDVLGVVWGHPYQRNGEDFCQKCAHIGFIVSYMIVVFIIFNIYIFISLKAFNTMFQLNSIYYYIRILQLLPISNSQYNNIATSFIKCFSNYLQMSTIFDKTTFQFYPYQQFHNWFGNTNSSILVGVDCTIHNFQFGFDIVYTRILAVFAFPLFCVISQFFICLILRLSHYKQLYYFKYTIIFFIINFFLPSFLSELTKSISCKKIGVKSYILADLSIECTSARFQSKFNSMFVLPIIVLLLIYPIIIFFKLRKVRKILNYTTTKYKYGFYYLEFKEEYYYWEIIRLMFKASTIIVYNVLGSDEDTYLMRKTICLILIQIYLYFLAKCNAFRKAFIQKIEYQVGQMCSIIILIEVVNKFLENEGISIIAYFVQIMFDIYCAILIINLKIKQMNRQNYPKLIILFQKLLPKKLFDHWFRHLNRDLMHTLNLWKKLFTRKRDIIYEQIEWLDKLKKLDQSCEKSIRGTQISQFDNTQQGGSQKQIQSAQDTNFKGSIFGSDNNLSLEHNVSILHKKKLSNFSKKGFSMKKKLSQKKKTVAFTETNKQFNKNPQQNKKIKSQQTIDIKNIEMSSLNNQIFLKSDQNIIQYSKQK